MIPDEILSQIAQYTAGPDSGSEEAWSTARLCLKDSIGCALLALKYPECTKLLGPVVPGASLAVGARVPGTDHHLDPVQAAFNFGTMIRWLDYNDTWLAAEWGHPSDNLGAILMLADYLNRRGDREHPLRVRDVLAATIKAYEIQGVLAMENAFNRVGLDHVLLVRVASTAVATRMLGGTVDQTIAALSHAWLDGGALRTYRQAPSTGSRRSWAAGDATSRAVRLALLAMTNEMGYPAALSAPHWGFQDVLFDKRIVRLARPLGSYVMENILFKVSFPAEFHGQTAVEAAIQLHPTIATRFDQIERIRIETTEPAIRLISKTGHLKHPADRDHCLQYMVAIGLLHGELTANHYQNEFAEDPRVDQLREKMQVIAHPSFSHDYLDPAKRSIANAVQVFFLHDPPTERVEIDYPLGHRRRREESIEALDQKFKRNVAATFPEQQLAAISELFDAPARLDDMPVDEFVNLLCP